MCLQQGWAGVSAEHSSQPDKGGAPGYAGRLVLTHRKPNTAVLYYSLFIASRHKCPRPMKLIEQIEKSDCEEICGPEIQGRVCG